MKIHILHESAKNRKVLIKRKILASRGLLMTVYPCFIILGTKLNNFPFSYLSLVMLLFPHVVQYFEILLFEIFCFLSHFPHLLLSWMNQISIRIGLPNNINNIGKCLVEYFFFFLTISFYSSFIRDIDKLSLVWVLQTEIIVKIPLLK